MLKEAQKLVDGVNELKKDCMAMIGGEVLENLDYDQYAMIKKTLQLLDDSGNLMIAQAEMMESMNAKLDKLVSQKGE